MELKIEAQPRTILGKRNNKLRRQGKLPAILYGRKTESQPLEIGAKEFEKIYKLAGESTLVDLVIGNEKKKVLIHDVAQHFMSQTPVHVDFYEVDLTRKLHAKIPLHFTGVSPAVKELAGILIKNLNELEIEALPADLPPFIEVNIEKLAAFEDMIRVADLKLSEKVKVLNNPEEMVASVQPPRSEEELAELEKPTAEQEKAAIEGMTQEEKAEAAPTEGEEAPAEEKQTKEST